MAKKTILEDLYDVPTLGVCIMNAFQEVAPAYGARLEGLPDDANDHSIFWQRIAAQILKVKPPADD